AFSPLPRKAGGEGGRRKRTGMNLLGRATLMRFTPGTIDGITWKPLTKYHDQRGWLCELFRHDEMSEEFHPAMAYASVTEPGVARGPHEHVDQADYFCFFGPSDFKLYLWDTRPFSLTY